jgi:hypothetical protein
MDDPVTAIGVELASGVFVAVDVGDAVGVSVEVDVGVSVGVSVGVAVGVSVAVGVDVGVSVGVEVRVGVTRVGTSAPCKVAVDSTVASLDPPHATSANIVNAKHTLRIRRFSTLPTPHD